MAETRLCPNCKEIMKPCCYAVGKQDGTERLENKIFSYDGSVILGKLVVCTKCGQLSIVRYWWNTSFKAEIGGKYEEYYWRNESVRTNTN